MEDAASYRVRAKSKVGSSFSYFYYGPYASLSAARAVKTGLEKNWDKWYLEYIKKYNIQPPHLESFQVEVATNWTKI